MRARWWIAVALVGTAVAVTSVAVTSTDAGSDEPTDDADASLAAVETAVVERRDLIESDEFDGELGYGPESKATGQGGGVITALPDLGSTIGRGDPLWEVDGAPGPRLLFGDRPMWRELRRGVDDGADVRQLEENLFALGLRAGRDGRRRGVRLRHDDRRPGLAGGAGGRRDRIGRARAMWCSHRGSAGCRRTSVRSVAPLTVRCSVSPA